MRPNICSFPDVFGEAQAEDGATSYLFTGASCLSSIDIELSDQPLRLDTHLSYPAATQVGEAKNWCLKLHVFYALTHASTEMLGNARNLPVNESYSLNET